MLSRYLYSLGAMVMLSKWWRPTNPDDVEPIPWLHPACVAYLDILIQPDWRILEHGCGGSTLWFAKRAREVIAHEHNNDWLLKLSKLVGDTVSLRRDKPSGHDLEQASFDLILIDGARENRAAWCMQAPDLIKPGGIIVFDNPNRPDHNYPMARQYLKASAKHFITFDVNPPGHSYAVTDFYRMPGGKAEWI